MNNLVLRNIIYLFGTKFAGYIIPLISLPYLTKVLGPQAYGELGFATAICQYFIIIVNYGFDLSATQKVSQSRNNKYRISQIFYNLLAIKLSLFILGLIVVIFLTHVSEVIGGVSSIVFAVYLSVLSASLFPQWLFQGKEQLGLISLLRVLVQFVNIIFLFAFVNKPEDVFIAAVISIFPGLALAIFSLIVIYLNKWIKFVPPTLCVMRIEFKSGWDIFVANIVGSAYQNSIAVFLGFFSGSESVAIYTAAQKLFKASQGLYLSVSGAFFPHVNKIYKESAVNAKKLIFYVIKIQSLLGITVGISIFLASDMIVNILFGVDYIESAIILKILSPLPFVIGVGNCLGIQTLLTFGFKKEMSNVYLRVGFISLFISIPSCYFFGSVGAAVTVLFIELLVTTLLYIEVKDKNIL